MRTRQAVDVQGFEDLEGLFVVSLLHLQHTLHQFDFVSKSGIGELLQIGLQIILQLFVPRVEPRRECIVLRLHLRCLSGERRKVYGERRKDEKDESYNL